MPRLPRVSGPEILRALRRGGWDVENQRGSHVQLVHATRAGRVTVPVHRGKVLKIKTISTILKQAGLTADEFIELL